MAVSEIASGHNFNNMYDPPVSADLNSPEFTICSWDPNTLNSPKKENLTTFDRGVVITSLSGHGANYKTQLGIPNGDLNCKLCIRVKDGANHGWTSWEKVY